MSRISTHRIKPKPQDSRPVPWKIRPIAFTPLGKGKHRKSVELSGFNMFPEGTVNTNEGTSGPTRDNHGFLRNWVAISSVPASESVENVPTPTVLTQKAEVPQASQPTPSTPPSSSSPSPTSAPASNFPVPIWVLAASAAIALAAFAYPKSFKHIGR